MYYFPLEKVNIILDHINCGRKILIDFDKSIAKLIVEKDFDFKKALDIYFDPKNVEAEIAIFCEIFLFGPWCFYIRALLAMHTQV